MRNYLVKSGDDLVVVIANRIEIDADTWLILWREDIIVGTFTEWEYFTCKVTQ